jgi:chromosome segregation ATPase
MESEMERHSSEEAVMARQIDELQDALETRQTLLTNLRNELSTVRDELRQSQIDYQTQVNRVATLENEAEVLRTKNSGQITPARRDAMARDSQYLGDQIARLKADLASAQSSLAESRAQGIELAGRLRQVTSQENDTLQVDQERLGLRSAKMKLENEVRRLKDENKSLNEGLMAAEKAREDETVKAASQEERLREEMKQLQSKTRLSAASPSKKQELQSAQQRIRELEQQIKDYDDQLAKMQASDDGDDIGNLSVMRRDLSASRRKELEVLQKEAAQRDNIKDLNMQIADLERQLHENKVSQMMKSPSATAAKFTTDSTAIRQQLSDSQRALEELRSQSAASELMASRAIDELQRQLSDLEDQKLVLEEVLEEANQQAEEAAAQNDKALRRVEQRLDKAERERNTALASQSDTSKQGKHLKKSQAEIENLEHDVRQQQELINGLAATEASLRRKLDRARSERAAFRLSAEKLQRDIQLLQVSNGAIPGSSGHIVAKKHDSAQNASDHTYATLVRAAEGAEERHKKELKGMVMQMEWMQARWEREASLRSDAAYAKKFIQLQLDVANAWWVFPLISPFPAPFYLSDLPTNHARRTATRRSCVSSNISAPTFFTARSPWPCRPPPAVSSPARKRSRLFDRSLPWLASLLACALRHATGPSRSRFVSSWLPQGMTSDVSRDLGN